MRKLTLEYVKDKIEEAGCTLLSEKYINSKSKLKILCDKGHIFNMTWGGFNTHPRCPICTVAARGKAQRLTIEYIKEQTPLIALGYQCISEIYENNHTELQFLCPNNHIYLCKWNSFSSQGHRCPICSGNKKYTFDEVKKIASEYNYEVLSTEYINCGKKLKFKCDQGHIYHATWNSFNVIGTRCPICAGKKKPTIDYIKEMVPKLADGYTCLSNEYKNNKTKLEFICAAGHKYKATWGKFKGGERCRKCYDSFQRKYTDGGALEDFRCYRVIVNRYSNLNYIKYYHVINPNKLKRAHNLFHLDHIYTVVDGFANGILPEIIANPTNLQMLPKAENIIKKGRSDMTKEELLQKYNEFIKEEKTNE